MQDLKIVFAIAVVLLTSACSAVVVDSPIGETPLLIDPADWEGEWLGIAADSEDRIIGSIEVMDASNGIIRAMWIEDGEPRRTEIHLRQAGDWTFASVPYLDDFEYDGGGELNSRNVPYIWVRIVKSNDQIFLWAPRVSRFRELITEGQLPGELREGDGDAHVGDLTPENYALFSSDSAADLFEWDEPAVLIRIGE